MPITTIAIIAIAIAVTALISWLIMRAFYQNRILAATEKTVQPLQALAALQQEHRTLQTEKERLLQDQARTQGQLEFLDEQYTASKRFQEKNEWLQNQLAMFKEKFHGAEEKLRTQERDLQDLGGHFKNEFKNLAQTILEEKTEKFTRVNEEKMNALLVPLRSQLVDFRQKVEETYDRESKERFSLGKEVQRLVEASHQISQEANNLTTALKGNNKMQGNWGEMILESLLENSGLTKGREYFLQEFIRDKAGNIIKDDQGKGLQPDVTIYYPDQRKIIIDSKVSLIAWEQYVGCNDREDQQKSISEHARSIRSHIDSLSRKNYPRYALALDYVLLFVPIEPALMEAVKLDMLLWKYAYDKKILLVSPTNLFAVLKIIADLWKVEQQNRHAIEIADKAGSLYDKFSGFIDNMEVVGKKMGEATNAYNTAFGQLSTGKGNILNRVEELKKMGANAQKQLPDKLVEGAGEEVV